MIREDYKGFEITYFEDALQGRLEKIPELFSKEKGDF